MGMFDDLIPQKTPAVSANPSQKPYRTDPPPAPTGFGTPAPAIESTNMFADLVPDDTAPSQDGLAVGKAQSENPFIDSLIRTLTQSNPNAFASTLDAAAANEPSPLFPKMRYVGDESIPEDLRKQSDYVPTNESINPNWSPEKGGIRQLIDRGLTSAAGGLRNLAANEENLPELKNYGIEDIVQGDGILPALRRTDTFIREGLGSAAGSMVPTVAGGIAGFAIPTAMGQPQMAPVGAIAGAFAPSYALNAGGVWDALKEENAKAAKEGRETLTPAEMSDLALGAAIPISALDVTGLESIASGLAGSAKKEIFRAAARKVLESSSRAEGLKEGAKLLGKETAKEAGKGMLAEGATEGGQQAIQDLTTTKPYGKDFLTKETALDVANNAIIGGLAGGARGAGPVSLAPSINAASKRIGTKDVSPEIVESSVDAEPLVETANKTAAKTPDAPAKYGIFADLVPEPAKVETATETPSETAPDNVVNFPEKKKEPEIQRLVTPRGDQEIEAMFDVVDAKSLITSDSPDFPQVLQPRDRSRKTSDLQIQDISNKLDPERLSESRTTDTGAPIVSMDNIVESGNGRVMGIRKAYEQGNEASKKYKDYLASRGYDVSGMEAPVLVRKRRTELSPEDRVRFTIASNERTGASLSSTERAMADAKAISDDMAAKYQGGDVTSPDNRGFINSFISQVAPADRGSMISADGELSQDGVRRVRGALLAKAYDDSDVVQSTLENNDTEIKSIGNALTSVAGQVAAFKAGVEKGETPKALDITKNVIEAAKIIRDAKASGKAVSDSLTQEAMFDEQKISPVTEAIIRSWYNPTMKRQVSQQKIEGFLRKYYEEAAKANDGGNMFGLPDITPQDIIDVARPRNVEEAETGGLDLQRPLSEPQNAEGKLPKIGGKNAESPAKGIDTDGEGKTPDKKAKVENLKPQVTPEKVQVKGQKSQVATTEDDISQQVEDLLNGGIYRLSDKELKSFIDTTKVKKFDNFDGLPISKKREVIRRWLENRPDEIVEAAPKKRRAGARGGDANTLPEDMGPTELKNDLEDRLAEEAIATGKAGRKTGREFAKLVVKSYENWLGRVADSPVLRQLVENHLGSGLSIQGENVRAIGKTLNQTEQLKTNTPEFKKWFGDSKVVDADGKPLVVYHGSPDARFLKGDDAQFKGRSARFGGEKRDDDGAFWFASSKSTANSYADDRRAFDYQNAEAGVESFYVSLKNPLIVEADGKMWRDAQQRGKTTDVMDEAREKGHDGVIIKNVRDDYNNDYRNKPTDTYVAFQPEQIKSVNNRGTFDANDARILYQRVNESADGLRSALVSAATNMKQAKGSGEQMLGILRNTSGVKEEEIAWTGMDEFLSGKPSVTKQEIMDYLNDNQVQIEEVTLGKRNVPDETKYNIRAEDGGYILRDASRGVTVEYFSTKQEAEDALKEYKNGTETINDTKFSQYTLPNGENYREVLLTLANPPKQTSQITVKHEGDRYVVYEGDFVHEYFRTEKQAQERVNQMDAKREGYNSSHFDQKNILAHVRLNDRIDADGKKVLFVEEIQSDWHQAGRRKGYNDVPRSTEGWTAEKQPSGRWSVHNEKGEWLSNYSAETESEAISLAAESRPDSRVPNAPFKKSWHEMALRRIAQMAAQDGYDSVAWTTGEQQNDRYDLSKSIDKVEWRHEPKIEGVQGGSTKGTLKAYKDGKVVMTETTDESNLEDYIGKDVAKRLLEQPHGEVNSSGIASKELSGVDLKVGGDGMKGFYDNILVKYANKFGKKFDAKVGETSFQTENATGRYYYDGPDATLDQVSQVFDISKGRGNTRISPITNKKMDSVIERVAVEQPMRQIYMAMKNGTSFTDAMGQFGSPSVAEIFGGDVKWIRGKEESKAHSMGITQQMRDAADKGFELFQKQDGEARGSITFMPDGKTLINMFNKADASTPFHELGHDFLELLKNVSRNQDAPENVTRDWKTTQDWLGLSDNQPITVDQHEQFARGFEAYLREGKAPTVELKSLFDTFKQWLTDIYRSISKLNVELTDDMRGVFDRMIAGEKIEDIASGDGEMSVLADRSSKIPAADISKLTKTERASLSKLIWEESGYDADVVQRYSLDRQFEIAEKSLNDKFGIKVQMGKDGNKRHAVDNMADLYVGMKTMAALNGLPEKLMGLQKVKMDVNGKESGIGLRFVFKKDKRNGTLGAYFNKTHQIHVPGRSNSVAHEWAHALDYSVLEAMGDTEDAAGRAFRGYSGKIRRVGEQNFKADSVVEAWVDLMNTIFFDDAMGASTIMALQKKIETTKSDKVRADAQAQIDKIKAGNWQGKSYRSEYFRSAKSIPTGSDKGYWTRPTEMVARAMESFMSDKFRDANLPTDIMTFGNEMYQQGSAFEKLYPQGPDRDRVFAKIAAMMKAIQESDILDSGNLTPAELPKEVRVDPLAMVKKQDMRKYPTGIIGQVRKELGQVKALLNDIRNPDAKALSSAELAKGKESIKKDVDGWAKQFKASTQERKVLMGLTRNPEKYVKPPKMDAARFGELKAAAIEIRKTYNRPLADRALSNLKTMAMAINSSEKAMIHAIEARNPKSKALSQIITNIAASPGKKRDSANTYTNHKRQFINKYGNRLAAIVDNFGLEKGLTTWKKNKLETQLLRDLYFNPDDAHIPSGITKERAAELATAAAELNRLIKDVSYEFDRAGIDVGETHDVPYLRRIYDKAKIWSDKKGFVEQARKTYLIKYEKDIGKSDNLDLEQFIELAKEAGFKDNTEIQLLRQQLAEAKKEQMVPAPVMTEISQELYDTVVDSASRKDAQDWLNNMYVSPEFSMGGSPSGFMKARALPSEADQLLQDYMVSDPVESTLSLIDGAADKVSWRKYVEPEDGYLLNAERQAIADGWHFEDTQLVVDMIRAEGGRAANSTGGPIRKAYQAIIGSLHTAATVALMGRSVFASITEPIAYLHRTGHWGGSIMVWKNLVKEIVGKADAREKRRIIQAWGLIENRLTAINHAERSGGTFEDSPRTQRFMNRFFESNLLAPMTRAQRSAAMQTLPIWFNVLSHDVLDTDSKPHRKRAAIREFVEAGIPENKVEEFSQYVQSLNMGFPSIDESYMPKTMPQMYMNAIGYVTDHIIQNPSRMDRPMMANSPTGRFVYGLMTFQFAYYDNIIKRKLTTLREDFKEDGFAVGATHTAEFAATFALQVSLAATVFLLRTALFNPDLLEKKMEDEELFDYVAAGGFSYASPLSPLASMGYNIYSSAKYQKDLSNYFMGAQASYYLQPAESWFNYFMNNSENTDTQDRKAMEASYRMFIGMPSSLLSGLIPGGGILGTTYGIANMFISSRGAETAVSEAVYGPKDQKKKKKTEKRYLGKNIGRSE